VGNQDAFGFGAGLAVPRTAGNGAEVPVLEALRNGEVDLLRIGCPIAAITLEPVTGPLWGGNWWQAAAGGSIEG